MPKRYCILLTLATILFTHVSVGSFADRKNSVFLEGSLLFNLGLFGITKMKINSIIFFSILQIL